MALSIDFYQKFALLCCINSEEIKAHCILIFGKTLFKFALIYQEVSVNLLYPIAFKFSCLSYLNFQIHLFSVNGITF